MIIVKKIKNHNRNNNHNRHNGNHNRRKYIIFEDHYQRELEVESEDFNEELIGVDLFRLIGLTSDEGRKVFSEAKGSLPLRC